MQIVYKQESSWPDRSRRQSVLAVGTDGLSHKGTGHVGDSDTLVVGLIVLLVSM